MSHENPDMNSDPDLSLAHIWEISFQAQIKK